MKDDGIDQDDWQIKYLEALITFGLGKLKKNQMLPNNIQSILTQNVETC